MVEVGSPVASQAVKPPEETLELLADRKQERWVLAGAQKSLSTLFIHSFLANKY